MGILDTLKNTAGTASNTQAASAKAEALVGSKAPPKMNFHVPR